MAAPATVRCITEKPFFVSERWLKIPELLALAFCFSVFIPAADANPSGAFNITGWIIPGVFALMALLDAWKFFTCRDYGAYAFTDESFREVLNASLKRLDLPYETALYGVRLPTLATDIRITEVSPRWGSATLHAEKLRFRRVLNGIVTSMDVDCRDAPRSAVNLKGCACYAIFGILILGGLGVLLIFLG